MAQLGKSMANKVADQVRKARDQGFGNHEELIGMALLLADTALPFERKVYHCQQAWGDHLHRPPAIGEIERALLWAERNKGMVGNGSQTFSKPRPRVKRDQAVIDAWAGRGSLQALMKRSGKIPKHAEAILEEMYEGEDLLHISPDIFHDQIKSRSEWVKDDLSKMQYFCPSTFKSEDGGRLAENVERRRWVVFETDDLPKMWDEQCGLIERLDKELPCQMVVTSGNKSLHSFHLAETPLKDKIQKFHDLVIMLGGDASVLRPSQMVRFPLGKNTKTGETQKVIFYAN